MTIVQFFRTLVKVEHKFVWVWWFVFFALLHLSAVALCIHSPFKSNLQLIL